eukprot:TRINITY_DN66836_c11_g1_i1.p1 TRINITY_DN66836_c11_g1~~TRINITY_DN66836_c11_g1_i1.p1  ORF type:complete len:379 (+),score=194.35 TRINITY_DN66836_c11_g1_i1:36-1172(+)
MSSSSSSAAEKKTKEYAEGDVSIEGPERGFVGKVLFEWLPCFAYVALFVASDILIASTNGGGKGYKYTPGAVIILSELGKFIVSFTLFLYYGNGKDGEEWSLKIDWELSMFYSIPALLFTMWNIINYRSLLLVDLSMFSIIYQVVVFFTAMSWCFVFNRKLKPRQWGALVLLCAGCFMVHVKPDFSIHFHWGVMYVIAQAFLSAVAGVYNEYLLKKDLHLNINEQNSYLYFYTTITSLVYLAIIDPSAYNHSKFFRGFDGSVVAIIMVQVGIGISVSMILKHLNIIVKLFATALHSPVEVTFAHILLKTPFTIMVFVASVLIGIATTLFYYKPESERLAAEAAAAEQDDIKAAKAIAQAQAAASSTAPSAETAPLLES